MARWPAARRCKRRLAAGVGSLQAARIQQRLTSHTLSIARSLEAAGHLSLRLALSGCGPRAARRWLARPGLEMGAQGPGSLGERMRRQLLQTSDGRRSVLLIGTDLPSLEARDLLEAIHALKQHPLVLGPADDGGYWLMGLTPTLLEPVPAWPFSGVPWGSDQVLSITLKRAREHGLTPQLLRSRNDVDRLKDLGPWLA